MIRLIASIWYSFCLGIVGLGLLLGVVIISSVVYCGAMGAALNFIDIPSKYVLLWWIISTLCLILAMIVANYTGSMSVRAFNSINWRCVKLRIIREVKGWWR